jgi:hypothetical protein
MQPSRPGRPKGKLDLATLDLDPLTYASRVQSWHQRPLYLQILPARPFPCHAKTALAGAGKGQAESWNLPDFEKASEVVSVFAALRLRGYWLTFTLGM